MKDNLALLHAFEVLVVHKCLRHKNQRLDNMDLHDLCQVFYPLIDILKPMVDAHSKQEYFKAIALCIQETGAIGIEFNECPCSMHQGKWTKRK